MKNLILILGDQISHNLSSLKAANKAVDIVLMAGRLTTGNFTTL